MVTYTIYRFSNGQHLPGISVECTNDDAALTICRAMTLRDDKSEVWAEDRLVDRIDKSLR